MYQSVMKVMELLKSFLFLKFISSTTPCLTHSARKTTHLRKKIKDSSIGCKIPIAVVLYRLKPLSVELCDSNIPSFVYI